MKNKSEMINRIAELAEENAKLNAIIDGYQPRLQRYRVEIAELQAYKDVNEDFKTAWEELKAENERLKEKIESYVCSQNCYAYKQADKYRHILQEIKEIINNIIDGYIRPYGDYEQLKNILDIINKAEEEWK